MNGDYDYAIITGLTPTAGGALSFSYANSLGVVAGYQLVEKPPYGPLHHFAISGISGTQTAGTPMTGITITAQDSDNITVSAFNGTVAFSGTAGITGTSGTFSSGVLTGVSVTPTGAGGAQTFVVTDGSGKSGTSTFVVNPTTASKLAFTTDPSGAVVGSAFAGQPVVKTQDAYGNNSTVGLGANNTVTIAIKTGTGTLQGTKTYDIGTSGLNGTITGSGLRIDQAGSFTLSAIAAMDLSEGDSGSFTVAWADGLVMMAAAKVQVGTTLVGTLRAIDADVNDTLTYSVNGGIDMSLFKVTGAVLSMNDAPVSGDNNKVYHVEVAVSDGMATERLLIEVTVTTTSSEIGTISIFR